MRVLQPGEAWAALLPYISGRRRRKSIVSKVPDENLRPPTRLCQPSARIAFRVGWGSSEEPSVPGKCTLSLRRPAPAPRPGSAGAAAACAHAQWRRREPCLRLRRRRLPVPQSLPAAVSRWLRSDRLLTVNLQQPSGRAAAASAESGRGAGSGARRLRPAGSGECGARGRSARLRPCARVSLTRGVRRATEPEPAAVRAAASATRCSLPASARDPSACVRAQPRNGIGGGDAAGAQL